MAESNDSNANSIPLSALPIFSQLPPISVKLTDGNFLMWQRQVDVAVCGYGLEAFFTGEATPPPQMIPDPVEGTMMLNPAYIAWQRQDRRVAGWLLSSLSEGALVLVVGFRSVCAVTSRTEPWSIADVSSFLLSFESRMEVTRAHATSFEGSQPSLNLLQQQPSQKRESNSYNTRFDPNGGRGGSRNQRGGRGGRGFGRGGNKIICQLCEKPGHSAAKCWHRFEQNYTPPQMQKIRGNLPQQQNFYNPSAHIVQSVPRTPSAHLSVGNQSEYSYDVGTSSSWYPDSEALQSANAFANHGSICSIPTISK